MQGEKTAVSAKNCDQSQQREPNKDPKGTKRHRALEGTEGGTPRTPVKDLLPGKNVKISLLVKNKGL